MNDFNIYGYKDSYIEKYAKENNIPFVKLDKELLSRITGLKQVSNTTSSIKLSWIKQSAATGYQIYRATSKTGTYSLKKTVTSASTLSYTNTGLTKGKTYYYKVRAYKTVNSKKVYSSYSTIKYVKVR